MILKKLWEVEMNNNTTIYEFWTGFAWASVMLLCAFLLVATVYFTTKEVCVPASEVDGIIQKALRK